MKVFIIEENNLREQYRFLVTFLALSALVHFKKRNITHFLELTCSETKCHGDKRIVSTGRTYGIELVLNSLPSLVKVSAHLIQCILDCFFFSAAPALIGIFQKFTDIFVIALLRIRSEDLIHFRYSKSTILLCRCT